MKRPFTYLLCLLMLVLLCHDWHMGLDPALAFDYYAARVFNALLLVVILLDLATLAVHSFDLPNWNVTPTGGFDRPDFLLCLLWSFLNLSWWGILAIGTDTAVRLFAHWTIRLQNDRA